MDHFYQTLPGCFTFAEFYAWIAESARETWRGVEVGALNGQSAACLAVELINVCAGARLDLVELSDNRATLRANLAPVSQVIGMIHSPCSSVDASKQYTSECLDFVMLDAGHDYINVREDIDAWWPKIRAGGILAGHDFSHYFPGSMAAWLDAFPRLQLWRGSLWPDDTVHGQRRSDAEKDIATRSADGRKSDWMPVAWVRK